MAQVPRNALAAVLGAEVGVAVLAQQHARGDTSVVADETTPAAASRAVVPVSVTAGTAPSTNALSKERGKDSATLLEGLGQKSTYDLVVVDVVRSTLVCAQGGAVRHRGIRDTVGRLSDGRPHSEGAVVVEQDGESLRVRSGANGSESKSSEFHAG